MKTHVLREAHRFRARDFFGAPVGIHCILDMYQCPPSLLNDAEHVSRAVEEAVRAAGATLLKSFTHRFDPQGVTAIALLAESHLSIHTWPERGYAAVDIFTCGKSSKPEEAMASMVGLFKAGGYSSSVIERGRAGAEIEARIVRQEVRL
jgi:S-adenosylmethionine decarboxylase